MGYKESKNYIVYMHESPSGKKYIGITHLKPSLRWRLDGSGYDKSPIMCKAINKYGWDSFKHTILENNLTYNEACIKEKKYIQQYNTIAPNGYNIDAGGYDGTCFKKKILVFNNRKECYIYDSITSAADYIGISPSSVSKVINKPKQIKGFFYAYTN